MGKHEYNIPVRVSGLAEGLHQFDIHATPEQLSLPQEFDSAFDIHVELDKILSQIVMTVAITSTATYPCDRCLAPVRIPIEHSFTLFFAQDPSTARMLDDDEVRVIDPNEPVIDLAEDVRDYALLSISMRRTCGEDSNGNPLCTTKAPLVESVERGIDPRWEKLRDWNKSQS